MKSYSTKKEFKPFDVTITIETQKESNALYTLFNFSSIVAFLESYGLDNGTVAKLRGELTTEATVHCGLDLKKYL